jgi:hypothetical protein
VDAQKCFHPTYYRALLDIVIRSSGIARGTTAVNEQQCLISGRNGSIRPAVRCHNDLRAPIGACASHERAGKAASMQAGAFVRDEIRKIRRGQHGARLPQQAIAIGLSKARRAGVALRPPGPGKANARTRRSAEYAYEVGQHKRKTRRRPRISRAVLRVLKREPKNSVSHAALSRQARRAASRRPASQRAAAARKAVRTKGFAGCSTAARKAAQMRAHRKR